MRYQVTWLKEQHAKAQEEGKGLFAVALYTRLGRAEVTGLMDHDLAEKLFRFGLELDKGTTPDAAFKELWPDGS
jgi:hypothetical protein